MFLHRIFLLLLLGVASTALADSYVLTNIASTGVTSNPGEFMQTSYLSGGACGFTPTHTINASVFYWYGPAVTGTYATGSYNFLLWTNQPGGGLSNVQVDFGYTNADGSSYVPEGATSIDVNASGIGNHITTYTFPAIPALALTNQRLRLRITQGAGSTGAFASMVYNACTDFDTKLVTPALAPFGTPTISPTPTLTPTATPTSVPALNKSVNTGSALVGETITYTLNYQNPNPNSASSCRDDFENGTTQWTAGWSVPTGATWTRVADNGPSLPGSSALDAVDAGGYFYTTFNCATPATDGSIQVDVKALVGAGEFTILWRQNGSSTYQLHVKQGTTSNIELRVTTLGAPNTLAIASYTVPLSGWLTYKFEVVGFSLKGYINGSLVISGIDPNNTFNSGNAGIEIDSGGVANEIRWDNVIISNYAQNWYNVSLIDTLPTGLTYVSNSCGGSNAGQVVTIALGTLNAAASGTCKIVAYTNSCLSSLNNQGRIQVGLPAHVELSNNVNMNVSCASPTSTTTPTPSPTATPSATPKMQLTKTVNQSQATIGDTLTFCLSWVNDSSSSQVINIWDTVSPFLTYVGCSFGCTFTASIVKWTSPMAAGASGQGCFWARVNGVPP